MKHTTSTICFDNVADAINRITRKQSRKQVIINYIQSTPQIRQSILKNLLYNKNIIHSSISQPIIISDDVVDYTYITRCHSPGTKAYKGLSLPYYAAPQKSNYSTSERIERTITIKENENIQPIKRVCTSFATLKPRKRIVILKRPDTSVKAKECNKTEKHKRTSPNTERKNINTHKYCNSDMQVAYSEFKRKLFKETCITQFISQQTPAEKCCITRTQTIDRTTDNVSPYNKPTFPNIKKLNNSLRLATLNSKPKLKKTAKEYYKSMLQHSKQLTLSHIYQQKQSKH